MRGLLAVIVLLFLTVTAIRAEERLRENVSLERRSEVQSESRARTRFFRGGAILAAWVLGLATAAQTILAIWGPFWPTSPEIHPDTQATSYTSSVVIKNSGGFFSMKNVEPNCLITHVWFAPDTTHSGIQIGESETPLKYAAGRLTEVPFSKTNISPHGLLNYSCDAMPNAVPLDPSTGNPRLDLIIGTTFTVRLDYDVELLFFSWHQQYDSQPITWQKAGNGGIWHEGPVLDDVNTPKGPKIPGLGDPKKMLEMSPFSR